MVCHRTKALAIIAALTATAAPASAYIGPGAGLSALGSLLALLAAILLGIIGFVWYPIKRLLTRKENKASNEDDREKTDINADPRLDMNEIDESSETPPK